MNRRHQGPRPSRGTAAAVLAACFALLPGCLGPVPFHERGRLQDPIMAMAEHPCEGHWYAKVVHSMEGSIGAAGSSGGGGCGCY
ncbi:MAG: DUF4266 domain-containing protein [Planctomycetota bacterium]